MENKPTSRPSPDSDVPRPMSHNNGSPVGDDVVGTSSTSTSIPVNPGARKRIRRACDKCSKSRTRCDGDYPW